MCGNLGINVPAAATTVDQGQLMLEQLFLSWPKECILGCHNGTVGKKESHFINKLGRKKYTYP
jgi:hypothetical protein